MPRKRKQDVEASEAEGLSRFAEQAYRQPVMQSVDPVVLRGVLQRCMLCRRPTLGRLDGLPYCPDCAGFPLDAPNGRCSVCRCETKFRSPMAMSGGGGFLCSHDGGVPPDGDV